MAASKKRRKLPEEDLAASVAEILNNPITRANLSFLRPPPEAEPSRQMATPMGLGTIPPGHEPSPPGVETTPGGCAENAPPETDKPGGLDPIPMGLEPTAQGPESTPGGAAATPPALRPTPPGIFPAASGTRSLWQAEGLGSLFEHSRVRRIERAQDALSLVEEKVYDLLWGTRNLKKDEYRLVHFSLQRIANEARINIKTVRELIPRLVDKGFLAVEQEADPRRNIPTLYRVWSYAGVLAHQRRLNRLHVIKTGKGVFYVHPVAASLAPQPMGLESYPVGVTPLGAGLCAPGSEPAPAEARPPGPLGAGSPKPMGPGGPPLIDNTDNHSQPPTTSPDTFAAIVRMVQQAFATEPDTALLESMIAACHRCARETTGTWASDEELLYFIEAKARVLAHSPNIRNHLAVLRRAVPECFSGEAFRLYRTAAAARRREAEDQAQAQARERLATEQRGQLWTAVSERHRQPRGYDMEAILADPDLDEAGRRIAAERLRRLGRFTASGL